ncbi:MULTISPECIES: urea amidolyase associated protein UAAP1 [unclassified Rhizobium]|uniref:urea amidolyase associated protein UAAP1 n=1 Tax=unclassified Rhizobium TaxID=2613769 RepID=UPI001ADC6D52|nr:MULTISPECIES: urea amidolyase associated protein UAAP1 [unclassified Rhizobium]MBO9101404.1 urea carboxylase-associated family protein [Rhizobium sp. L58/93]QXZ86812.1 urea carboxylase-associated family protein [Rhizobium sp. K1/93]QXZ93155.1 urea carboxylase-associated family protein [Rhizobium sp. K15/93]
MHIHRTTDEIAADRARYEEHQRRGLDFAPRTLPAPSPVPAPEIPGDTIIHQEVIPGGWYWSTLLKRGEGLRIDQKEGTSTVALVAWNAADTSERLNLVDTAKIQWTTALSKGRVLFSDMGRVMFSIIEDSAGTHDCLMGGSNAASNAMKYSGVKTRNTRDNLVLLAGKLGLQRRDIPGMLNLFAPVRLDKDGGVHWQKKLSNSGDYAELRAEMDLLVGFSNCPHPLDPNPTYAPTPVTITRFRAPAPTGEDLARTATAEAIRGFENNAMMQA